MKDLNNKAVKVHSKEEARDILRWLRANTKYDVWSSEEEFLGYWRTESYIAVFGNRIFIPVQKDFSRGIEIISKEEFMGITTETLEQKKERLSRELQEVEEKIKEEKIVKPGDYVQANERENANYWKTKGVWVVDTIKNGYVQDKEGHSTHLYQVSKLSKKELEEYLVSIPKEKEYTLKAGNKLRITKNCVKDENKSTYTIESINVILERLMEHGFILGSLGVKMVDFTLHVGCEKGPDVSLNELKEIVAIAESLK